MNIIGLVGPIACGKGVVAQYLIEHYGYTSFSLSSIIHDEVKKRGIVAFTRTTLQDIGDELRKNEGEGVLAKRAIESLKVLTSKSPKSYVKEIKASKLKLIPNPYPLTPKVIIEGIRNLGEIEYLRTIPGFLLIAVDAHQKVRYHRVLSRGKPWDPTDWQSFQKVDGRDRGDKENNNGQQVRKCMELADVKIDNNGSREQVEIICEQIMGRILKRN